MPKRASRRYTFGGGINTLENPAQLRDDELSDARNIELDQTGSIMSRNGQARVTTSPANANRVTSLYQAYKANGTKQTLFFRNQTMYKVSGTDGSSIDSTTFTAHADFSFATFGDVVYYTNGVDTTSSETMRKYDFSSASAPSDSPATVCRKLIASTRASRLFAIDANSDILYASAINAPEDWTTANDAATIRVRTPDGENNQTGVEIQAGLLIFKTSSLHILTGTDPQNFQLRKIADIGTTAWKSVAATKDRAFFLHRDTFYETDGTRVFPISRRITPTIQGMTSLSSTIGVVYPNRAQYRAYMIPSGGTTNTRCLKYNYDMPTQDGRRPWLHDDSVSVASAAVLHGGSDNGELYTGAHDGYINRQDTTSLDIAADIVAYADTPWNFLDEPERFKKFKKVWVLYEPTGSYNLLIYPSFDGNENTTVYETIDLTPSSATWDDVDWDEFEWSATETFNISDIFPVDKARSLKLRFYCEDPFKVYGYSIIDRPKRVK